MGKQRNVYGLLVENPFVSDHMEDGGRGGRVLLKWVLWK